MLSDKGEPEQARKRLGEALAIFQRLGAARGVEWTERAVEALDTSTLPA